TAKPTTPAPAMIPLILMENKDIIVTIAINQITYVTTFSSSFDKVWWRRPVTLIGPLKRTENDLRMTMRTTRIKIYAPIVINTTFNAVPEIDNHISSSIILVITPSINLSITLLSNSTLTPSYCYLHQIEFKH